MKTSEKNRSDATHEIKHEFNLWQVRMAAIGRWTGRQFLRLSLTRTCTEEGDLARQPGLLRAPGAEGVSNSDTSSDTETYWKLCNKSKNNPLRLKGVYCCPNKQQPKNKTNKKTTLHTLSLNCFLMYDHVKTKKKQSATEKQLPCKWQ